MLAVCLCQGMSCSSISSFLCLRLVFDLKLLHFEVTFTSLFLWAPLNRGMTMISNNHLPMQLISIIFVRNFIYVLKESFAIIS